MRKRLKTAILAVFMAGSSIFALLYAEKAAIDRYRAPSEDIENAVVSIIHGDRHTVTITDKETGTQWTFKTVLRSKGKGVTEAESDNLTITGAGRYVIVTEKATGKEYKVKP